MPTSSLRRATPTAFAIATLALAASCAAPGDAPWYERLSSAEPFEKRVMSDGTKVVVRKRVLEGGILPDLPEASDWYDVDVGGGGFRRYASRYVLLDGIGVVAWNERKRADDTDMMWRATDGKRGNADRESLRFVESDDRAVPRRAFLLTQYWDSPSDAPWTAWLWADGVVERRFDGLVPTTLYGPRTYKPKAYSEADDSIVFVATEGERTSAYVVGPDLHLAASYQDVALVAVLPNDIDHRNGILDWQVSLVPCEVDGAAGLFRPIGRALAGGDATVVGALPFRAPVWVKSFTADGAETGSSVDLVWGWLVAYERANGTSSWGWARPDLTSATGPIWSDVNLAPSAALAEYDAEFLYGTEMLVVRDATTGTWSTKLPPNAFDGTATLYDLGGSLPVADSPEAAYEGAEVAIARVGAERREANRRAVEQRIAQANADFAERIRRDNERFERERAERDRQAAYWNGYFERALANQLDAMHAQNQAFYEGLERESHRVYMEKLTKFTWGGGATNVYK
ncbi:MAG: hypothetical protein R3F34_15020 [Planctomycetota bacterium]